ncbi:MAG: SdrD B-like domain-containing protein, partial [Acidobacteriota bacterium]
NTPLPMHSGLLARVDFGNFRFMTIRGRKFHDLNGNGTLDTGESGLAGWEIELDLNRDGTVDRRATTDSSGNYEMLNVGPGDPLGSRELSVSEVDQPGWSPTFPTTGHIYPIHSGVVLVADFGNAQGTGICGAKYEDLNGNGIRDAGEPGIGGWTIELAKPDGSTEQEVTDAGGGFCFSDLEPGNYTVREASRQAWIRTQPGGSGEYAIGLESGQSRHDIVFGNFHEAELCGLKFNDLNGDGVQGAGEPGLAGWTIRLSKPDGASVTKQTEAGGSYCCTQLGPGSHTIREVQQTGWVQTYPASSGGHTVSTESGKTTSGLDFGNRPAGGAFVPVSICGTKFEDVNGDGVRQNGEPGLTGWTIELLAGTSTVVQSVATGAAGSYCFGQVGAGTYTIRETLQNGWVRKHPSGAGTHTVVTESGHNLTGLDFGNFKLGRITGKKYNDLNGNGIADASESGLAGWTIFVDLNRDGVLNNPKLAGVCDSSALEPCAKTDANGGYTIGGLDIGNYALREVQQPGWRQTTTDPADASVSTSGSVLSGMDFGNVESASAERAHLYFPFYQAGSGIFTAFAVSNYSSEPANVKFTAYNEQGDLCLFDENPAISQLQAGHQLARLGNEIFGEEGSTPQLGWVEVTSDNPGIGGFFQFGTSDLEGLDGSASISEPSSHFYLTRIYEFYEPDATIRKTFDIPARGLLSGSAADLFGGLQGAGCIEVEIQDSGEAVGFELIRQISPKSLIGLNAATPGEQTFQEDERERTQEFVLRWSPDPGGFGREIVRQQYNFSPPDMTCEREDYVVELDGLRMLELVITPDISGGETRASLAAAADPGIPPGGFQSRSQRTGLLHRPGLLQSLCLGCTDSSPGDDSRGRESRRELVRSRSAPPDVGNGRRAGTRLEWTSRRLRPDRVFGPHHRPTALRTLQLVTDVGGPAHGDRVGAIVEDIV